jgi:hypothetical protein
VEGEVVVDWTDGLKVKDVIDVLHPALRVWCVTCLGTSCVEWLPYCLHHLCDCLARPFPPTPPPDPRLPAEIVEVSDIYGIKVNYVGVPKSQQYSNGYFLRESTCLALKGTKAKTEEELAEGACHCQCHCHILCVCHWAGFICKG